MRFLTILLLLSLTAASAAARSWLVVPDTSGEAPHLQAAVDSCALAGDSILLADGDYSGEGNRDVRIRAKSLWLGSVSGDPELCRIDCGGSPAESHRGLLFEDAVPTSTVIQGIGILNGDVTAAGEGGGAVKTLTSSRPTFVDCIFQDCSGGSGGAVHLLAGYSGQAFFTNCVFRNNVGDYGGALNATGGAAFTDCRFEDNLARFGGGAVFVLQGYRSYVGCEFSGNRLDGVTVNDSGGALYCSQGIDDFTSCLFRDNEAGSAGGIYISTSDGVTVTDCVFDANEAVNVGAIYSNSENVIAVTGCTFQGNLTPSNCTIKGSYLDNNGRFAIDRCIFAFNTTEGPPVQCTLTQLTCTNIFGNSGGDWNWGLSDYAGLDGNFAADPEFCARFAGDLSLSSASPCLPGNHPDAANCDLVGALGEGCSAPAVAPATWSEIKSRY